MDKLVKISIVVGVLLAGIGIFYHYVIFLPSVEREKIAAAERVEQEKVRLAERVEQEKVRLAVSERASAETREYQRQVAYENCNASARRNYEGNWASACKLAAQSNATELRNCLNDRAIMSNQFMGAEYCNKMYSARDASPDCALSRARSEGIEATLKREQEKCVTEARLGL